MTDLPGEMATSSGSTGPVAKPPPPIIRELKVPQPKPVTIDVDKTALLVLELSELCADPEYPAHSLIAGITNLLDRARSAGMLIIFTIPHSFMGQAYGNVYSGFERRPSEPLFFPSSFDKLSGDVQTVLKLSNIEALLMVGQRSNIALLHTATKAAADFGYMVIIPVDGIAANTDYEKEYGLIHFTLLPRGAERFTFTSLDMLSFSRGGD